MTNPNPTDPAATPVPPAVPAVPAAPPAPAVPQPTFTLPPQLLPPAPASAAPPAVPAAPAAPAPQTPPATGGPGQTDPQPVTGEGGEVYHYPANTAVASMTPQQQAEYWRHRSRKHEDRVKAQGDYDALKQKAAEHDRMVTENQTVHERAVADARRQGHAEALAAASGQLVEQWVRAAAHQRSIPQESVNALVAVIKPEAFLTNGGVDADKVYAFVNAAAPQPASAPAAPAGNTGQPPAPAPAAPAGQPAAQPVPMFQAPSGSPDFGQGQPGKAGPTGLEAGRALARARFGAPPGAATTPPQ